MGLKLAQSTSELPPIVLEFISIGNLPLKEQRVDLRLEVLAGLKVQQSIYMLQQIALGYMLMNR